MIKLSIIIPCYNEEKSIGTVLESIESIPKGIYEVIVVDNNSTDKTSEIARKCGAKVVFEKRMGYGRALKAGFGVVSGDIIVTIDGDAQYPAEIIFDIVKYLEENNYDFVSASRFPMRDKKSLGIIRRFGNGFLTFTVNALFGIKLKDSQSGMWVFKREILNKITLESDGMPMSEEIKIKAAVNPEIKFSEFNIGYKERIGDSKLMPIRDGFRNLIYLFKLRRRI